MSYTIRPNPKSKAANGTATTPTNHTTNPPTLNGTSANEKEDPATEPDPILEKIAAAKIKKEQEDRLKIGKSPKEFSKLKHEIRVPKSKDFRLHKPYPCNQTYVTHGMCDTEPKKKGGREIKREKTETQRENGKMAGKVEKAERAKFEKGNGGKK